MPVNGQPINLPIAMFYYRQSLTEVTLTVRLVALVFGLAAVALIVAGAIGAETGFFPIRDPPKGTTGGTRRRLAELLGEAETGAAW